MLNPLWIRDKFWTLVNYEYNPSPFIYRSCMHKMSYKLDEMHINIENLFMEHRQWDLA